MSLPGYGAEASLYQASAHYRPASGWASAMVAQLSLAQLMPDPQLSPQVGIVCDGSCPPVCHIHCLPCRPDPTSPTGCSRTCTATGPDCDNPGTFTSPCPASACCPTTCGPCSGGSCGTYPNCAPVPNSGRQTCTDCHGATTTRPC